MLNLAEKPQAVFDVERVRAEFPILQTLMHGRPLVYLDNAATTQKPRAVIETLQRYYEGQNANIHRGVYTLSQETTALHEEARGKLQRFLNAAKPHEIIFTRGTTESINLVANCLARGRLKAGDEIIISAMEHHSNIVPWQMACEQTGAVLRAIPVNGRGELELDAYERLLNERTRLVAITHVSNALGTINPVAEIIAAAHRRGAWVLVDGAQWVAHHTTDVQALDADFYACSGHKMLGPTGIGVLYGKEALLEALPPWQGGGDMIESVTFEKTTYAGLPNKFEAGTPHIAGAIGLGAAVDFLTGVGLEHAAAYEETLLAHAMRRLEEVGGLRLIGTAARKSGVLSLVLEKPAVSSLDIGLKLDAAGVAVRTGHHCCQPVMERFGIAGTARASLAFYNTVEDIDALVEGLKKIVAEAGADGAGKVARGKSQAVGRPGTEIVYPGASGASPQEAADELADEFAFMDSRDAKNEYLLELGQRLPDLFGLLKQVTPRVEGCMAEVYLVGRRSPVNAKAMEFVADADAAIVRGLIAVLERIYSGQALAAVAAFDIEGFFRRIELDQFVTAQRRNGLQGMIKRLRNLAAQLSATETPA